MERSNAWSSMIGVMHGYSLEGSGSNLWTRYMVQARCREGSTIHLICQEKAPEKYDFIAEVYSYGSDCSPQLELKREIPYAGRCILHVPQLGEVWPVYVGRFLESTPPMLPMTELSEETIQDYLDRNYRVVRQIVELSRIRVLHVNHAILLSAVAVRIKQELGIPYAVMPHGSEIEYVIRGNQYFFNIASQALSQANRIFVLSGEMKQRVIEMFSPVDGLTEKMIQLNLGVDTTLFESIPQSDRKTKIAGLISAIGPIPRGKRPEMMKNLIDRVDETISLPQLKQVLEDSRQYAGRLPDQDLEAKLLQVEWPLDPIILYAGRLISGKGIQLLAAAAPLILERSPHSRIIISGHGPLREFLELFLWALQNGKTTLIQKLIEWGTHAASDKTEPFTHIQLFYNELSKQNQLDSYFETAGKLLTSERVFFTGYLKHTELRYLFSCSDVAVFPSIVPEAGPLVFLEALASGCFPIATYVAGAAVHIDRVSAFLPPADAELMKIRHDQAWAVSDIVNHTTQALFLQGRYRNKLREIAKDNYDWRIIAQQWFEDLQALGNF